MADNRRKEVEDQLMLLIASSDDDSNSESSGEGMETDVSADENAAEDFGEIDWTNEVRNDLLTPDKERVFDAGPVHDLPPGSTPLQFLKLFFTDDVCEVVQLNINKYAELRKQKRKKTTDAQWKPIENLLELWCFFCIIMICGIVRVPKLTDYWSNNDVLGNQAVKRLMSRKRFQQIVQYFYTADGDDEESKTDDESFSFTQTVEPIMDNIRKRFLTHFKTPRELLVQEAFVENKICTKIFQYMPLKMSRCGLKMWTLSSPAGYVFNFDLYTVEKGKARHDVVNRLLTPIESKGHHIYLDKFFTSVPLMIDIYKGGNRACGSVTINRKYIPKELRTLQLKEFGEYRHFQCVQCPDLLCCVWCDNEDLFVLSTNSKIEFVEVKMGKGPYKISMECPSIIHKYKKYMGCTERPLRSRNYCSRLNRTGKWWRYLFSFLLDSCLNNAFIVYASTNTPPNQSPKTLVDFKLDIIEEILKFVAINPLLGRNFNLQSSASEPFSKPDSNSASSSPFTHRKVKIKGRKKACRRCSKLKRKTASNYYVQSSFMCNTCQICLCVSCFGAYHSENKMEFS